jgi:hypothetical protein
MKILTYLILNKFIKDPVLSSKICDMLYDEQSHVSTPKPIKKTNKVEVKTKPSNTSQDLRLTLKELKSKTNKTKKDKESIGILEAVIKNGYS